MSVCRYCGQEIGWAYNADGKPVPVDTEPVLVIEGGGTDSFYTYEEGENAVIRGRAARPEEESRDLPVAYASHWKTCRSSRRGGRG